MDWAIYLTLGLESPAEPNPGENLAGMFLRIRSDIFIYLSYVSILHVNMYVFFITGFGEGEGVGSLSQATSFSYYTLRTFERLSTFNRIRPSL